MVKNISSLYSTPIKVQETSKIDYRTQETSDRKRSRKQSAFETTEVLAEKVLMLEKRIEELERKIGK